MAGDPAMDIQIRTITEEDTAAFDRSLERAFGQQWTDEERRAERAIFEIERNLGAFDGTEIVGTAGAYSLTVTVPGGSVPMAGVSAVGVQPSHRRRGVLTKLMRRQL